MKSCNLSKLPAFGVKTKGGLLIWADARSEEDLKSNGFVPTKETEEEYSYYGVCLYEGLVIRTGTNYRELIEKSEYNFYIVETEKESASSGRYLWKKMFGKEEFLTPYGY